MTFIYRISGNNHSIFRTEACHFKILNVSWYSVKTLSIYVISENVRLSLKQNGQVVYKKHIFCKKKRKKEKILSSAFTPYMPRYNWNTAKVSVKHQSINQCTL
jgi:hypothetical protein